MRDRTVGPEQALKSALPDIPLVEMTYERRGQAEKSALREAFQAEDRQAFLQHLLETSQSALESRGFTERNLESLRRGKVPHGYNVHHIRPLDDGGDNRFDNLVLLRAHPEHEAIHRYLDPQLRGLDVGQARRVILPLPTPGAYRSPEQDRAAAASQQNALRRQRYGGFER